MKRNAIRKMMALALVFSLLVAMAACSGNSGTTSTATDPPATVSDPTAAPDTTTPDPEPEVEEDLAKLPVKDLGGRDIRILTWYTNEPIRDFAMPGQAPDPETSSNYAADMMFYDNMQSIYNDYNVTFSYTEGLIWDDMEAMLTTSVMAGDPAGDLVMLDGGWVINAIASNLIVPFNDYLPADNDLFTSQTYWKPTAELQDKVWTANRTRVNTEGEALGVNLDIIKAIGAENPVDLYNRGEWTYDAFMDIARLATKDTDGDTVIDQYGISGVTDVLMKGFIAANDGMIITDEFNYGYDDPKTMRALEFCYQIFNVDKVWNYDPSIGEDTWDWARNMYAFQDGKSCFFVIPLWAFPETPEARTFEYTVVPFPKGPDNTTGVSQFGGFMQGLGIPRGVKDVEDVLMVWEKTLNWYQDDFDLRDEGDMSYPYSRFNNEEDALRFVDIMSNQKKTSLDSVTIDGYVYNWSLGDFPRAFAEGSATPAQKAEELRPWLQGLLDTAFEFFK